MNNHVHVNSRTGALFQTQSGVLAQLVRMIDAFFFRPADPATLGLLRICCGLLTLFVHIVYTADLQKLCGKDAWLGLDFANVVRLKSPTILQTPDFKQPEPQSADWLEKLPPELQQEARYFGVDPRSAYSLGNPLWSIWFHVTDPTWMMTIHVVILLCMFLFTIGFCTRITSVLTWMGAMCYLHRAPTTVFGQDTMMNIALIYLMIAPSGAAFSVDRLLRRYRLRGHLGQEGADLSRPRLSVSANFVMRLFQIHFCFIYFWSGAAKLKGNTWWSGSAMWWIMANTEFVPLHLDFYRNFMVFLCEHRWLWELVTYGGVLFTLVMELGLPFLIWSPVQGDLLLDEYGGRQPQSGLEAGMRSWMSLLRAVLLIGVVLLHVGIALVMGLTTFSLFMLVLALPFVPPEAVRGLVDGLTGWLRFPFRARRLAPAGIA